MKESFKKFVNDFKDFLKKSIDKKTRKSQIPNMLTASRLFAPLFIIPASIFGNFSLAFGLTIVFASTDAFDGWYARKYNLISDFGKDLDALTDKIFAGTILISLLPIFPLLGVNIFLEWLIGNVNLYEKVKGNNPKSSIIGKIKTVFLSSLVIMTFGNAMLSVSMEVLNMLFFSTTLLQSVTAIDYVKKHYEKERDKKIVTVQVKEPIKCENEGIREIKGVYRTHNIKLVKVKKIDN